MDNVVLLSIIVPTFNEGDNVRRVVREVAHALPDTAYEIVFVDDSTDHTPLILEVLSHENLHIRVLHRTAERGLGSAIVRGFKEARGSVLAVMDGDLQHPPSVIPVMLSMMEKGADLVVPSRFIPGGSDGGLTLSRKFVSLVARWIAQVLFSRVRSISDPTGGLFMLRREVIDGLRFDAGSWKILIEILVRGCYGLVIEIPYTFRARDLGTSKMSYRAQFDYLWHLFRMRTMRKYTKRASPCKKIPQIIQNI